MKAYYKGLFKIHEVEIIGKQRYIGMYVTEPWVSYKYLVKFKSGKIKLVKDEKIIVD